MEQAARQDLASCLFSVHPDMCDPEEDQLIEKMVGIDDVTGEVLDATDVREARLEELEGFRTRHSC